MQRDNKGEMERQERKNEEIEKMFW